MAPACRCLWCAFFSSFAAVLLGNTAISGSALRMISTAWWLISVLFCIFTYTDLTIALVLGTPTIAHATGSTWQAPGAGSLTYPLCSFWKRARVCQSPKGPFLNSSCKRMQRIKPLKCRQRSPAYVAELLGLTSCISCGASHPKLWTTGNWPCTCSFEVYPLIPSWIGESTSIWNSASMTAMNSAGSFCAKLHAMLGTRDIFDALCFYRYMLEGQVQG